MNRFNLAPIPHDPMDAPTVPGVLDGTAFAVVSSFTGFDGETRSTVISHCSDVGFYSQAIGSLPIVKAPGRALYSYETALQIAAEMNAKMRGMQYRPVYAPG